MWTFFYDNCILNSKYMTFLVFSILHNISKVSPILKYDVPSKLFSKYVNLNMKILFNTPNWDRLRVQSSHFFPHFEPMGFFFVTFFLDACFRFAICFFCFALTFLSGLIQYDVLYSLLSASQFFIASSVVISTINFIKIRSNWGQKKHFLKYGENKESHILVFTIDNTIVIKKNLHKLWKWYRYLQKTFIIWYQTQKLTQILHIGDKENEYCARFPKHRMISIYEMTLGLLYILIWLCLKFRSTLLQRFFSLNYRCED